MLEFSLLIFVIFITPGPITILVVKNSIFGIQAVFLIYLGLVLATSVHAVLVWSNIYLFEDFIDNYQGLWVWSGILFLAILCVESCFRFIQPSMKTAMGETKVGSFLTGFGIEFTNPAGLFYYAFLFPQFAGTEIKFFTYGSYFTIQILVVAVVFTIYFLASKLILNADFFKEKLKYVNLVSAIIFASFMVLGIKKALAGAI